VLKTQDLRHLPVRGDRPAEVLAPHLPKLIHWVGAQRDISMPELAAKLEAETKVRAHPASLSRALLGAGFRYKNVWPAVRKSFFRLATDRSASTYTA
jgi:transposase